MIAALLLAISMSATPPSESALMAEAAIELTNRWRIDEADRTAQRALATAIRCGDVAGRVRALEAMSIVARLQNRAHDALDFATEALATAELTNDRPGAARAHNALGRLYADLLGDADAADEQFRAALANSGDDGVAARAQLNLGNLALTRRDLRAARAAFGEASRIAAKIDETTLRIAAEHNLGLTFAFQNDPHAAIESFRRALSIDRVAGGAQQARILLSIAEAQRAMHDAGRAAATLADARRAALRSGDRATLATILIREGKFDESERIARELSDRGTLALIDAYRASALLQSGKRAEAARLAASAANDAAAAGQLDTVAFAASLAGAAYRRMGDVEAARRFLDRAIGIVEQQRALVAGGIDARLRFFESELSPFAEMIELLVAAGDDRAALSYARRAKARILVEARPRARAARQPRDGEAFIEYACTERTVYAFVVTSSGTRAVALPASRERLSTLAFRFARELSLRNLAFRATGRALHDALIEPLALGAFTRLVIVPDADLWVVPFHALIGRDERFLIERATITYAPSTALGAARAAAEGPVLLAANLPDGEREVEAIRRVWPAASKVLNGATERDFRAAIRDAEIVHVAAHGVYDDADPMQSWVALSPSGSDDGRLTAREVLRMQSSARLMILSACDMAVGRPSPGEGLVGMTWALMVAGVDTVIAAKWEVDSEVTARLMLDLHRALATGASPGDALRTAQLAQLRSGATHPFYWAAFVTLSASPRGRRSDSARSDVRAHR